MGILVKIRTPDQPLYEQEVDEAIIPTSDGDLGVLEGHSPSIAVLEPGILRLKWDNIWTPVMIVDGVVEIKDDVILIITTIVKEFVKVTIEDLKKAKKDLEKAKTSLKNMKTTRDKLEAIREVKEAKAQFRGIQFVVDNDKKNKTNSSNN